MLATGRLGEVHDRPQPIVRSRVKNAMIADLRAGMLTMAQFKDMKEVAMEQEYNASRDTCRKARDEVLSKFDPRQIAVGDK